MEMTIDMAKVDKCTAWDCAFNCRGQCQALAITVGDGLNARCDTFFEAGLHCRTGMMAGVGACKVSRCRFNVGFSCTAPAVVIGIKGFAAECWTCRIQ